MLSSNPKLQDRSLRLIIPFVVGAHLLFALLLTGLNQEIVPIMPKKGVVVHSVKLKPKVVPLVAPQVIKEIAEVKVEVKPTVEVKAEVKAEVKPAVEVKEEIKPKVPPPVAKPQQKPVAPKPVAEKKPAKVVPKAEPVEQKKQVVEKKKIPPPTKEKVVDKEWIALAKEKIGKIAISSDSISKSSQQSLKEIATPSAIENFITDLSFIDSGATFSVKETAYRDELSQRLKLYLKLPEYGEVKIKMTVDRSGKVIHIKVLSFQSAKNAAFIEQNLPKIKMPPFGDNFKGSSDYDFTIVLSNE